MPYTLPRVYYEVWKWGKGPLDTDERGAAVTLCDRAWCRMDAKRLLSMCGLLRKDGKP